MQTPRKRNGPELASSPVAPIPGTLPFSTGRLNPPFSFFISLLVRALFEMMPRNVEDSKLVSALLGERTVDGNQAAGRGPGRTAASSLLDEHEG